MSTDSRLRNLSTLNGGDRSVILIQSRDKWIKCSDNQDTNSDASDSFDSPFWKSCTDDSSSSEELFTFKIISDLSDEYTYSDSDDASMTSSESYFGDTELSQESFSSEHSIFSNVNNSVQRNNLTIFNNYDITYTDNAETDSSSFEQSSDERWFEERTSLSFNSNSDLYSSATSSSCSTD